jgi:hypothetical protein
LPRKVNHKFTLLIYSVITGHETNHLLFLIVDWSHFGFTDVYSCFELSFTDIYSFDGLYLLLYLIIRSSISDDELLTI